MTSVEEVKPNYPSTIGRVLSSGNGVWKRPRVDVVNRTGVVGNPEYYPDLYEFCRSVDVDFWWRGRTPEAIDPTTRLYSARELAKQEAKAKRKQRKEQLSCQKK